MQKKDLEMYIEGCQMMLAPLVTNSSALYTHTHTLPQVQQSTACGPHKVGPSLMCLISLMAQADLN